MSAQLQVVQPVAQVDIGDEQQRYRDEHDQSPLRWDVERSFDDEHQQQPPQAEQCDTHPLVIEELREIRTQIGEYASGHDQLLFEEQRGVEE